MVRVSLILQLAERLRIDPVAALERMGEGASTPVAAASRRSWRAAYVAAFADRRMRNREVEVGDLAVESLPFFTFDGYCQAVWSELQQSAPLYVSEVRSLPSVAQDLLADADASARWAYPPADALGMPRTGSLAGTEGIVGYVDVQQPRQVRLVALREIAHLLRDEGVGPHGHDLSWAEIYYALQQRFLDDATAATWACEWTWWLSKALEHLDGDSDWLTGGPERASGV
jgi:hypothetical protein